MVAAMFLNPGYYKKNQSWQNVEGQTEKFNGSFQSDLSQRAGCLMGMFIDEHSLSVRKYIASLKSCPAFRAWCSMWVIKYSL